MKKMIAFVCGATVALCLNLPASGQTMPAAKEAFTPTMPAAKGSFSPMPAHPRGVVPGRVTEGEELLISYRAEATPLSAADRAEDADAQEMAMPGVSVILYVYDTLYHWHVYEYPMVKVSDTAWTARLLFPAAAGFLAYRFREGRLEDNNEDIGYFTMVYRRDGRYMPGAEAGYGLLRSPRYGLGVPDYFRNFSISDTATYMWLSNEIMRQPGGRVALVLPYLEASSKFRPERISAEAGRAVNYLLHLPAPDETALVKAYLIAGRYVKDSVRADSIRQVLMTQYPGGALARQKAYLKAIQARTMEDRFARAQAFIRDFPQRQEDARLNEILDISYYKVYRNAIVIAIAEKKTGIVLDYRQHLPFLNIPETYYKAVEIPYDDWKTMDAATALPLSAALYERMLYFFDHQPADCWYYSPAEWKRYCEKIFVPDFRLHARILLELGRDAEALALARRAQRYYRYQSSDLNQTEAVLLSKTGHRAEMDTVLRAAVRINQATGTMIGLLKEEYVGVHGSGEGFDDWFRSLKDVHTLELMRKEIREERLTLAAPEFRLTDGNGQRISLRSLRGKTVVLDFWATWCAPCKAGMAGMNMAVKKYKKDPSVVFYFIDTQERTTGYKEKAKGYLKEMGYDFNVLFDDGKDLDTAYTMYAKAIHSSGIPFKIVIDPQGIMRFANIGYKGSPSGLADEMEMMIELAKEQGAPPAAVIDDTVMPYKSEAIFYDNVKDTIHIGATLTYPSTGRVRKAVILISGTGQQDRDGTMAGHKMFTLLADSLTRHGFAVLRSDDRGVGQTNGRYETSTTVDFAEDVLAAVRYLRSRRDLGLQTIGLLGHSEGGMVAAITAGKDTGVGFVISLSSPGTTGLEALLIQNRALVHSAPIPKVNIMRYDSVNRLLFTVVYNNADADDLESRLRAAYGGWKIWDDSVVKANKLDYGGHFFFPFEIYVRQATGAWYRGFIRYDAQRVLGRVKVPYLAINGDKDLISDGAVNLKGIADALARGGNRRVTTWLVPGLNHLYQHCQTCEPSEYAKLSETLAPEVAERIGEWVQGVN